MSTKKSTLGRNLQSLLGQPQKVVVATASVSTTVAPENFSSNDLIIREVPVEQLHRAPYQPRRIFDAESITELSESIRTQGIMQPLVVRKRPGQTGYEIIAGERRWRAAQQAELSKVPVIIREVDDKTAMALALIENVQREALGPLEEALAFQQLMTEYGLHQHELASLLGKSRTTITNLLRLLNLEPEVQKLLNEKHIELGHAKVLLGLSGAQQKQAAHAVREQHLSVRSTEQLVKRMLKDDKKPETIAKSDPDIDRLQKQLSEQLSASVLIRHSNGGKGELIIKYFSLDELSGILGHIK
jgi:ParB family transcriptional regulator, chromosome partitioning protein